MRYPSPAVIKEQWPSALVYGELIARPSENSAPTPDISEVVIVHPIARWQHQSVKHRDSYAAAICNNLPSVASYFAVWNDDVYFFSYDSDRSQFVHGNVPSLFPWQPDSENFRSLDEHTTVTAYTTTGGFQESLNALREIVTSIRERFEMRLSDDVEALLDDAVAAHGTPDDLEAWAHRLVEDVRDLND